MVNFIIYIRKFMACAIAHRLKVALRHSSAAERRIASAASVLSNDMLVDMPAHAVADRRAGKEASQRPGQTADRSTSDCADARNDGPDTAAYSRASIGSSTSAEVSSHSAHAAANSRADFLSGR